jgi:hypothetical protein
MKYRIEFSYTAINFTNGCYFQGKAGHVEVHADQPVNLKDPDHYKYIHDLIYGWVVENLGESEGLLYGSISIMGTLSLV